MKRILLSFCIFSIFSISVFSQSVYSDQQKYNLHQSMLRFLLNPQSLANVSASKTDAVTSYRVISQNTYDNVLGSISDSVKVNYITNGTSTYDYNTMIYAYNYPYNTSPLFNFQGIFSKPQIQFARYKHWQVNPVTLVYGFYNMDNTAHDASKNLIRDTAFFADSLVFPNMLHVNTFNSAKLIASSTSSIYHGATVDSAFKQYFVYDAGNKLIKDSMYEYHLGAWKVVSRTIYTYDASNNLTLIDNFSNVSDTSFSLPLVEQLKYTNTYDASNRLLTVQTSFYDGTLLKPYVKDTFDYTGVSTFHTSWRSHQYDAINLRWEPMSRMSKHLNAAGLPDSIYIEGFRRIPDSTWAPAAKWICEYDATNNPIHLYDYEYDFTAFPASPDFSTNYYYESFTRTDTINTTGILNESIHNDLINMYPNPANRIVYCNGLPNSIAVAHLQVFDMIGQINLEQDLVVNDGNSSFSLANLLSGNYMIIISDKDGQILYRRSLIKQ